MRLGVVIEYKGDLYNEAVDILDHGLYPIDMPLVVKLPIVDIKL